MPNGLEPFGLALVMDGLPQYEQAASRVSRAQAEMGHQAESAAARTRELGAAATQVGFALAGLGAAGLATARGFVMTAARAEELDVVLDRVAMSVGVSAEAVREQREAIKALGITHNAANQILMRLVQSNIDLTNATKIARAAQDLAVIGMRDSSATALDLAYAIASGNVVILRKYGIMLNLRTMLSTVGTEEERLTGKVNVQARSQLVMNALFQQAERVSGSYAAAMSTASKQLRSMARYTEEIARTYGQVLLPILSKIVVMQTRFSKILLALPPEIKAVISITLALGAALATAAGAAILLVPRMDQWLAVLRALPGVLAALPGAFASFLISPMGLVAAAAAAMGAAVIFNIGGMQDALVAAVRTAKSTLGLLGVTVQEAGRVMVSAWQEASQRSNAVLRNAGEEWAFHLREAGHEVEAVGRDISRRNFGIEFDPYRFAEGAAELMAAFASGLLDGLNRYVIPTIVGVVQAVADFLLGMSPPKVGPLSGVITGGAEVIRQWLLGMSEVSLKGVADIAEDVTAALRIPAFEASEALRELVAVGRSLDDVIRPIEDNFRRIQAAATIATYPLREQQRLLNLEIADLEEIIRLEDEKKTERIAALTDQIRLMDEMQSLDQARMRDLDREIAIEERAAAKGDQSAQQRLRELKAQRMEMASSLEVQEEQRRELQLQAQAEMGAASEIRTEAQKELTARELRRREIESAIAADQMMVAIAREQLELARALQIEDRIALEQQVDVWRRRQEELQAFGSMASDVLARYRESLGTASAAAGKEAKKALAGLGASAAEAAAQIKKQLEEAFDLDPKLEAFKERMAGIFAPVAAKIVELRENLNRLRVSFESLLEGVKTRLGPIGELFEGLGISLDWEKIAYGLGLVAAGLITIIALKIGIAALGAALGLIFSPIGLIVLALGAMYVAWQKNLFGVRDFVAELWERIDWDRIGQVIQETWTAIQEAIERIDWPRIGATIKRAMGVASKILTRLGGAVTANLEPALRLLNQAWTLVSESFRTALEVVLPSLQTAFRQISDVLSLTLGPLFFRLREIVARFLPVLSALASVLGIVLFGAISILVGVVSGLAKGIGLAFGNIVLAVQGALDVIIGVLDVFVGAVELLMGLFTGNLEQVNQAWEKMREGAARIVGGLIEIVENLFIGLGKFLIGLGRGLVGSVVEFWEKLRKKLVGRSIIPDMISRIKSLFTGLREFLAELVERIRAKAVEVWTSLKEQVVEIVIRLWARLVEWFEVIRLVIAEKWDAILAKTREIWELVLTFVTEKVTAMLSKIREKMTEIWDKIRTTFDDIKSRIFTRMDEILAKIRTIWSDIKAAVRAKLSEILASIGSWLSDIVGKLTDFQFLSDVKQAGIDIFQSLWNGLKDRAGKIKDWIRKQAQKWLDEIKRVFFFIGDPYSLAFMRVGEGMMEGLQRGLASMAPQVQQQMITSMPTPRMVALPTPASSATRIYNITRGGPSLELTAHYAREQTEASIRDDVAMMLALA